MPASSDDSIILRSLLRGKREEKLRTLAIVFGASGYKIDTHCLAKASADIEPQAAATA